MNPVKRMIAFAVLWTFSLTQILSGQEYSFLGEGGNLPVRSMADQPAAAPRPLQNSQTSDQFLEDENPLKPADDTLPRPDYEYERYEFKDALEEFRPEYAAAVIVKDLKVEDLAKLEDLGFETGILVLHGEIVLFTSGSEDEVGVMPAVQALAEKASLISHTHPNTYSKEGPSGQDLNVAVPAPAEEYVITHKGVYAYNHEGVLNGGNPYSYDWYIEKVHESVEASAQERDQMAARQDLNEFIKAQDEYNQSSADERITFRRGGTLSYTSSLKSSDVTTLPGSPYPYLTVGSSTATALSNSSNQYLLGYNVSGTADVSGFTISFDNASTPAIETQNISTLTYLTFGLTGPNTSLKFEVIDVNDNKDIFTLTNITNSKEQFWRIPVASISNSLDKTKIKRLNFIVEQVNTTLSTRTGTLYIRSNGLNTAVPTQPIMTSIVPAATNQLTLTLSGTKEANTSILINGVQAVARNSSTSWSAIVNLTTEGNNTFNITAKNSINKVSTAKTVMILKDTVLPTGSININSGALYAASQTVTLNLSATDGGAAPGGGSSSGINAMSFSTDNNTWSPPETYATSKVFTLTPGDGNKTVYVRYYDKAGNASSIYLKPIILDTTAPTGSMTVNNGTQYISQTSVTLNLSATDAGSGLDKMSFSSNGTTWSAAETYAASKSWTFASGDGNKTVYAKFLDKAGNGSSVVSVTVILDTVAPSGSIGINNNEAQTYSRDVTLTLTGSDATSGVDKARFSVDGGLAWSDWENVVLNKWISLPGSYGIKEVRYQLRDKAENTATFMKTIEFAQNPNRREILEDNTQLFYENYLLVREITPQAQEIFYRADGSAEYFRDMAGEEIRYESSGKILIVSAQGQILETIDHPAPSALDESKALKLAYAGGIEAFYVDGQLVEFRTSAGIRVTNFTLDSSNQIIDALMIYPDGKKEIIRKGILLRRIEADGSILDFTPKNFLVREITANGSQYFSYDKKNQTSVNSTRIFTAAGEDSVYDELGILRETRDLSKRFIYERLVEETGYKTVLNAPLSTTPEAKTPKEFHYDSAGTLLKMILQDGTQIFFADGKIVKTLDGANNETDYSYTDDQGILSNLQVERGGTTLTYDSTGFLKTIQTQQGTITRSAAVPAGGQLTDPQVIDILLDETGGSRLTDFELDAAGNILKGIIETKEGIKQTIENGILTGFQTVDGRVYKYQNNEAVLKEWDFSDGTKVAYGNGTISDILFPDGRRLNQIGFTLDKKIDSYTEEFPDGTKKIFRGSILAELVTPNGAHLFYGTDGMAGRIVLPDSSEEKITYSRNVAGVLEQIDFTGESTRRTYLPDGTLTSLLTGGAEAEIQNGQILKLFTRFGEVDTPQFNLAGALNGTVHFEDGTQQIIQNGILTESMKPNGVKVFYENGKVDAVETSSGRYEIIYSENSAGDLASARVRLASEEGNPEYPLIPFLLDPRGLEMAPFYKDDSFVLGGNTKTDSRSRFGSSGVSFDGSGDYFQVADGGSSDFQYGTEDFTIDFSFFLDEVPSAQCKLWSQYTAGSGTNALSLYIENGVLNAYAEKSGQFWASGLTGTTALQAGRWYHAALVRSGASLKLYLNGHAEASAVVSGSAPSGAFYVSAGAGMSGGGWYNFLQGSMDEIRISKGTARWNADFTLPTKESKRDSATTRLWHFLTSADHPEGDVQLQSALLGRSDFNILSNPLEIQSEVLVSGQEDTLHLAKFVDDAERGRVYAFSGDYSPTWTNLAAMDFNQGYPSQSVVLDAADNLPALTNDLADLNGDGFLDRVWIPASASDSSWWVQFGNSAGFDAPVQWTGVERKYDPTPSAMFNYSQGTLKYYVGRRPIVLADLTDINGDGLPDRVLQKINNQPNWYVQLNNGRGFDPIQVWASNVQPLSSWVVEAGYASEVRDDEGYNAVQPVISDFLDMDGDGLPDRIVRPYVAPFSHWFFQHNNGAGFDDAVLWTGVDASFDSDAKRASSMSWYREDNGMMADLSDLVDMNGDGKPDRLLLKLKNASDDSSGYDWYVQLNHGSGFDEAVLWSSTVRNVPGMGEKIGTTLRAFDAYSGSGRRSNFINLVDVTGDGKPDRVTLNNYLDDTAKSTWWVEVNTGSVAVPGGGSGFAPAIAWTGIEGASAAETSLSQDRAHYRSFGSPSYGREPGGAVQSITELKDVNGDKIPDRILFKETQGKWLVQYGTGSGFLPAKDMKIEAVETPAGVPTSRYDTLHVSLRADASVPATQGSVKISLGDPSKPAEFQQWTIQNLTSAWQDFYLPMDQTKTNAGQVKIEFVPASASIVPPQLYVDNMTFLILRPDSSKDWLDRLVTEENVLAEINSEKTQTLQSVILSAAKNLRDPSASPQDDPHIDWEKLLQAEVRVNFDSQGNAVQFQTLYGTLSKIENGSVAESTLPDGSKIIFSAPSSTNPQSVTQTVTQTDGSVENLALTYGRVRTVSRPGKSALQYSYEFNSTGEEMTIVFDPDSGVTERYTGNLLISRIETDGVETHYQYSTAGKLIHTNIVYKGRVRESFDNSEDANGGRIITTDAGVKEEYSATGKILAHTTPEGYRYIHNFEKAKKVITTTQTETVTYADGTSSSFSVPVVTLVDDPNGEDIHRVSLVSYSAAVSAGGEASTGEHMEYQNGVLTSALLTDGTRIIFNRTETHLLDAVVYHSDGTLTHFKDGIPFSVTTATGREISLLTDAGELVNPNESAVFHYQQALKLWDELVKLKWDAFQAPATLPIEIEYSAGGDKDGQLLTRTFAEGVTELYENGKIQQVLSPEGEVLILYIYDSEGNPTKIEMGGARRRLDSATLKLKAEVAVQNEEALARVADRQQVLNQTIEGQYLTTRDRLLRIRVEIEAQQAQIASINVKGKQARAMIGDAMAQIQVGMNQVNGALSQLAEQRANALAKLAQQVSDLQVQIQSQTADSYAQIESQNQSARASILRQEISPVAYHWYRKILGRDPSQTEYDVFIATAIYDCENFSTGGGSAMNCNGDLEGLKAQLLASSELADRSTQVAAIKARVSSQLRSYLTFSDADKLAFAQSLGIPASADMSSPNGLIGDPLVNLNSSETESILTWLNSRSLHFGQSAYLALEALLTQAGISFDRLTLATNLILIDILTGTITPLDGKAASGGSSSDLVISMYALGKIAAKYGLATYAFKMNYDALESFYDPQSPDPGPRIIAHINGNHYIIITQVTGSEVTYIDPGLGPENALGQMTLSKEEFLKTWIDPEHPADGFGFILSPRAPPASVSLNGSVPSSPARAFTLDTAAQMSIRGAFFGFITKIFKAIGEFLWSLVKGTFEFIKSIVIGLIEGIKSFLAGIGEFFKGLFTGDFDLVGKGLFDAFVKANLQIFGGLINAPLAQSSEVSKGLQSFGLPPAVIDGILLGTNIVIGSVVIASGIASGNPILADSGISILGGNTAEFLNKHTTLSPTITNIISLGSAAVGAFAGGLFNGETLNSAITSFKTTIPFLAKEFATAGLVAVGNSLGLDPRLQMGLNFLTRAVVGKTVDYLANGPSDIVVGISEDGSKIFVTGSGGLLDHIKNEVFSANTAGAFVSVGANFAMDSLGMPTVLQNFIPDILGQLAVSSGAVCLGADIGASLFKKITDNVAKFGNSIISAGQQVISFGQKIIEGIGSLTKSGFSKAVDFFSGIFDRKTQETLIKAGGGSIETALNNNCSVIIDGVHCAYQSITIDYALSNDRLSYVNSSTSASFDGLNKVGESFGGNIAFAEESDGVLIKTKQESSNTNSYALDVDRSDDPYSHYRLRVSDGSIEEFLEIKQTDIVSTLHAMGQDDEKLSQQELQNINQLITRDLLTGAVEIVLISKVSGQGVSFDRLQSLLGVTSQTLTIIAERFINEALLLGPRTNQEIAVHKANEVQKITNNPGKVFVIHTDGQGSIVPPLIRYGTQVTGNDFSVNHSALAFQNSNGEYYVIDFGLVKDPNSLIKTAIRVKKLTEFISEAQDVLVQPLPLTQLEKNKLINERLFGQYINPDNMQPSVAMEYNLGAAAMELFNSSMNLFDTGNICSAFISELITQATDQEFHSLDGDNVISPNEFKIQVEEMIEERNRN